jgi:hypothetical protein
MTSCRIAYALAVLLIAACPAGAQPTDPARTVTPLRGNLYRAQDGPRVTLFRVEPDAIVLVDPMSSAFARFLEQHFAERFPNRPVKYIVYTGVDLERVGGAGVFDRTAELIAHDDFDVLASAARQLSPDVGRNVLSSETSFRSRRTLLDGEAAIDLIYAGPGAVGAQALVYFRRERVLFAASHPSLEAPFSNREVRPAAVAHWTATAADIDFDLFVDGGGATATKADVAAADGYARAVIEGIKHANARDLSVTQLQRSAAVGRFDGTPFAQLRDADLAALYRRTLVLVFDAFGAVLVDRVPGDEYVCSGDLDCAAPQTGPAFVAGAAFSFARFRAVAEVGRGARMSLDVYSVRSRTTHYTFLGGYRFGAPGRINVTALGGLTYGMNRFTFVLPGVGGAVESATESAWARTFGADMSVPITQDLALVVPLRFTPGIDLFGGHTGRDIRVGAGLALTYRRQAM